MKQLTQTVKEIGVLDAIVIMTDVKAGDVQLPVMNCWLILLNGDMFNISQHNQFTWQR